MNTQRSRIACIAGAILLIVGSVAFIAHDRDAPVEQIRIYELPEADTDGTGKTETLVSGQPTWLSDNNAAVESDELDSTDTDTMAHAATVIEPCCPDDEELTEIASGQDINLDHNPVTPGLAADMKRDAEWFVAIKEYEKKYDALHAEGDRLDEEFDALLEKAKTLEGAALEAFAPKLKAQIAKNEAWLKKLEALKRQRPVSPIPTHTH